MLTARSVQNSVDSELKNSSTLSHGKSRRDVMKKNMKRFLAIVGICLAPGLTQAQYRFITIDVPGATATEANGNSTRAIAGDFTDANENLHGFVLDHGTFTTLDVSGAVGGTTINGINAPGQLAGTYTDALTSHAFFAHQAFFANQAVFTTLDPSKFTIESQGGFINALGQVVGGYKETSQEFHCFIWRNGIFNTFNVPGDNPLRREVAFGINDRGAVVGTYAAVGDLPPRRHGFLRSSNGAFTTIDKPEAVLTVAEGINDAGTIVGLYGLADGSLHGFVSNNGVDFTTVDVPDAKATQIFAINPQGQIVGIYVDSQDNEHGFLGIPVPMQ